MARPKAAFEFVQLDIGFSGHRNLKRFCRTLEVNRVQGTGHMGLLLQWIGQYSPSGDLSEYDDEDVSDAAEWEGDPGEFWKALLHAGYVDEDADGRKFHNWEERYATILTKRDKDANRQRKKRSKDKDVADSHDDVVDCHDDVDDCHADNSVTSTDNPGMSRVRKESKESKNSRGEERIFLETPNL